MARTRALAAGKLALMARNGGRDGAGQQAGGELVCDVEVWVGLPVIRRCLDCTWVYKVEGMTIVQTLRLGPLCINQHLCI